MTCKRIFTLLIICVLDGCTVAPIIQKSPIAPTILPTILFTLTDTPIPSMTPSITPTATISYPTLAVPMKIAPVPLVSGWYFTCALTNKGGVECWGDNESGALGDATSRDSWIPVNVSGLSGDIAALAAGDFHVCALTQIGGVLCWGSYDFFNIPNHIDRIPSYISGLSSGVVAITAGGDQSCALMQGGEVKCWGGNFNGESGNGSTNQYNLVPTDVTGLPSNVVDIAAGGGQTCALLNTGRVKCWGNGYGSDPQDVRGLPDGIVSIAVGRGSICGLTGNGGLVCWGDNLKELGINSAKDIYFTPKYLAGLTSGIKMVSFGDTNTCMLTTLGEVKCLGDGSKGQLGNIATNFITTPVDIPGLSSGVLAITTGIAHTCALLNTGKILCWGINGNGQLGNGTNNDSSIPSEVVGFP